MFRSSDLFRDQVTTITKWFNQWTECEQTVALYSLIRQLTVLQARFVEHLLQEQASSDSELDHAEHAANSLDFVGRLAAETPQSEGLLERLLLYFPLLYPGNDSVKAEYLKIIPKVLAHSIESDASAEPCRQLLTYALIHPAVATAERSQFTALLDRLQEQFTRKIAQSQVSQGNIRRLSTYLQHLDDAISIAGSSSGQKGVSQTQLQRQSSLAADLPRNGGWLPSAPSKDSVYSGANFDEEAADEGDTDEYSPPGTHHHSPLQATASAPCGSLLSAASAVAVEVAGNRAGGATSSRHAPLMRTASGAPSRGGKSVSWTTQVNDLSDWLQSQQPRPTACRRYEPVSPRSSLSSSSDASDHQEDDDDSGAAGDAARAPSMLANAAYKCTYTEEGSGMRDFPSWLKALRLHKYSSLFAAMTYEDMLRVDEKWLEARGVTKGARHKLAASIAKLRERAAILRDIEQEVLRGSNLRHWLNELRAIIGTPMKPHAPPVSSAGSQNEPSQQLNDVDAAGNLGGSRGDSESPLAAGMPTSTAGGRDSDPAAAGTASLGSDDIAALFARVMARMCTQLLVSGAGTVDDECYPLYTHLVDKCVHHEAFARHRKLLYSWKQQVQQKLALRSTPSSGAGGLLVGSSSFGFRLGSAGGTSIASSYTDLRVGGGARVKQWSSQQSLQPQSGLPSQQRRGPPPSLHLSTSGGRGGMYASPGVQRVFQQSQAWGSAAAAPGGYPAKKTLSVTYSGPDALAAFPGKQTLEVPTSAVKLPIHRTHSAPLHVVAATAQQQLLTFAALTRRPNAGGGDLCGGDAALVRGGGAALATEPEINARLDSLCRSMTEAALDPDCSSSESNKPLV